jgi:hypothetical protein
MKHQESTTTAIEHPMTSTFEALFEELVNGSERVIDIAGRMKKHPRNDDRYYDAMAELDVIITPLPILGRSLRREMDRLDDMFPGEKDEDEED